MYARNKGIKTFMPKFIGYLIIVYFCGVIVSWVFSGDAIRDILIMLAGSVAIMIFSVGLIAIYPDILLDEVGIRYRACFGIVHGVIEWDEVGGVLVMGRKKNRWIIPINSKKFQIYPFGKLWFNMLYGMANHCFQPVLLISDELENYGEIVGKIKERIRGS